MHCLVTPKYSIIQGFLDVSESRMESCFPWLVILLPSGNELLLESLFSFFTHPRSKSPLIHWILWALGWCPFCWVNDNLVLLSETEGTVPLMPWSSWESSLGSPCSEKWTRSGIFYNGNFQFEIYIKITILIILYIINGKGIRELINCPTYPWRVPFNWIYFCFISI